MSNRTASHRTARPRRAGRPVRAASLDLLWTMIRELFDPYRPERHYMRGPGPKWRAKHAPMSVEPVGDAQLLPA
jgi:hypothetical protein